MYRNYFCEIMRPPEFGGPSSGEPLEPWLIRHWVYQTLPNTRLTHDF